MAVSFTMLQKLVFLLYYSVIVSFWARISIIINAFQGIKYA